MQMALIAAGLGLGLTTISIYIAAILVFVLSIVYRPQIGIYFIVPLLPLQVLRYQLHSFPWGDKLIDFVLLGVVFGLLIHKRGRIFERTPLNAFLLLWAVVHYISLWRGAFFLDVALPWRIADPRFSDWKNYMEIVLIFLLVCSAIESKRQIKVLLALMALSVLRANMGFYNTVSGRDLSHFAYGLRYSGMLGYAGENGLAAFEAELVLFLIAIWSYLKGTLYRSLALAYTGLCAYCLLFTFSRGAYIGIVVGMFYLGVIRERKLIIVLVALVIGYGTVVPTAVRERIEMTYDGEKIDSSAGERVALWQDAVTMIPQRPIFGAGFDTYKFMRRTDYTDTHNFYVKLLVEMGVIGLCLFLVLLWKMWRVSWQLYRSSEDMFFRSIGLGLSAYIVCVFVVNFFGDRWMYMQLTGYLFALLGVAVRAQMITQEEQERLRDEESVGAEAMAIRVPASSGDLNAVPH